MSRHGNCLDNALTERFFRSLKSERVNYRQYKTRAEGMIDIADYIESFYNQKRRHSTLGNISPVEYEARQQNVKHADLLHDYRWWLFCIIIAGLFQIIMTGLFE